MKKKCTNNEYFLKKIIGFSMAFIIFVSVFLDFNLISYAKEPADANYYKAVFDVSYYASKYPAIANSLGGNEQALLEHFVKYGMSQGLRGNEEFDVYYYRNKYPDLQQAFGENLKLYYEHYIQNGKSEGRVASNSYKMVSGINTGTISRGDIITFGSYEQDGNMQNGKEPIEWYVLKVENGKALLLSRYVLDICRLYKMDDTGFVTTWSNSYLRYWMNNTFLNTAFNQNEQALIPSAYLKNTDSRDFYQIYGYGGGAYYPYVSDTYDKVFALSYQEVIDYCGVASLTNGYWGYASNMLQAELTPAQTQSSLFYNYVLTKEIYDREFQGTNYPASNIGREGFNWWLRSPGTRLWIPGEISDDYTSYAIEISEFGVMGGNRNESCASLRCGDMFSFSGVRPAIYINLAQ